MIKKTLCTIALVSTVSFADFSQMGSPIGSMNVFNHSNKQPGGWLWNSGWGLPDLRSTTTDNLTFVLEPNINTYADASTDEQIAYWRGNDGDGNKWMEANTIWERTIGAADTGASFSYTVDSFGIASRYTVQAFVKILDAVGQTYSVIMIDDATISSVAGVNTLSISWLPGANTGQLLQMGFMMSGMNANPAASWGSVTVTATDGSVTVSDSTAPTPDPMTFSGPPIAISDSAITMTATAATDDAFDVEYYFTCSAGPGNDSGWQSSRTYTDTGLTPGETYSYAVRARDTSPANNMTAISAASSATTGVVDNDAPTPNPAVIESVSSTYDQVTLTATTATDDSAVEYYFTSLSDGAADSGWQSSPEYTIKGLYPGTSYEYTVQVRDLSNATNTTSASSATNIVTAAVVPSLRIIPNGDFSAAEPENWTNAEGGEVTIDWTGGQASLTTPDGTPWAVLVNPTTPGNEGGGWPIEDLGVAVGDTVTFNVDLKTLTGTGQGGLKVEFWGNNVMVGSTGDQYPNVFTSWWRTHNFDWTIPAGTEKMIFVCLWGANATVQYDNVGVIPPVLAAPTISDTTLNNDDTMSITCDGVAGQSYVVQYKDSLSDDGWKTDSSSSVSVTEDGSLDMNIDTSDSQKFFRLITE